MSQETRLRILILGAGAMGSMFKSLLQASADPGTWHRDPENGRESAPLETLAAGNDVVILAVPAAPHDELAGRLAACLNADTLRLSIANGHPLLEFVAALIDDPADAERRLDDWIRRRFSRFRKT